MNLRQFRYHIPDEFKEATKRRLLRYRAELQLRIGISKCWIWTGHIQSKTGYGWTSFKHSLGMGAHRLSYLVFVGDIPEGWHVHHNCEIRVCFNPEHLIAVTPKEHGELDNWPTYQLSQRTHCSKGHEYTPENTFYKGAVRICRACRRIYNNEIYARRYSKEANGGKCWVIKKWRGEAVEVGISGRKKDR